MQPDQFDWSEVEAIKEAVDRANEPLVQDGFLHVVFVDGSEESYPFKDLKTWRPEVGWLIIFLEGKSIRWPSHMIKEVECVYNSQAYIDSLPSTHSGDFYVCPGCGTNMVLAKAPE
jgi:hypothetical protein